MSDAADIAMPGDARALAGVPGMRWWFVAFVVWMGGLALLAVTLLERYDQSMQPLLLRAWLLVLMCFYLSLCNSLVPLPTAWIVLLAASAEYALVPFAWGNVLLVACAATLGTVVANLNEYHVLAYLLSFGAGQRARRSRAYAWASRWFDRAPLQILLLVAFLPVPVDAVRWLAVLRRYPRTRFALAYCGGRAPRYALFAACSVYFRLTPTQILVIQAGLVAAALLARLGYWAWRKRQRGAAAGLADQASAGA